MRLRLAGAIAGAIAAIVIGLGSVSYSLHAGAGRGDSRPDRSIPATVGASRWAWYFAGSGDAYRGRDLYVHDRATGRSFLVGRADANVRPVWSPDRRSLLYVLVRQVRAFPGARWSLLRYDRRRGASHLLTAANGMNLAPLGWLNGKVLYALGRETDTGLYRVVNGHSQYISYLFTESLTDPSLSPGGRYVAFVTPADCDWCTIALYDMTELQAWFGPVGVPGSSTVAWTRNGDTLVTIIGAHVVTIDTHSHAMRLYRHPAALPNRWTHPMIATIGSGSLRLTDRTTGRSYLAAALTGASSRAATP